MILFDGFKYATLNEGAIMEKKNSQVFLQFILSLNQSSVTTNSHFF